MKYRIREVGGQDDEISDTLVELHPLTFFDGHPFRSSIMDIGGERFTRQSQSPLRVSSHQLTCAMPAISAASAC
jgi:hypothetical protein